MSLGATYIFDGFQFTQLSTLYLGSFPSSLPYLPQQDGPPQAFIGCLGHMVWDEEELSVHNAIDKVDMGLNVNMEEWMVRYHPPISS